jgi:hypothetical protein
MAALDAHAGTPPKEGDLGLANNFFGGWMPSNKDLDFSHKGDIKPSQVALAVLPQGSIKSDGFYFGDSNPKLGAALDTTLKNTGA